MKIRPLAVLSFCSLLALLGETEGRAAGVPQLLTQQGRLLDPAGAPVAGAVSLTFALYAAPSGGTALWSETQMLTLSEGYFSAQLGESMPLPPALWSGSLRYLGITVAGDTEMSPREAVASVPYAIAAGDAIGDIHPSTVSVAGKTVIDATGTWVGPGTMGPAGPAGPPGPVGPTGPAPYFDVQTAEQAGGIMVIGANWTPLAGTSVTVTTPANATLDMQADGAVTGVNLTGPAAFCGFRFVVDGKPQGDGTWGDRIVGTQVSGPANTSAAWWTPWSMSRSMAVSPGSHTVSLEMNGWSGTMNGCTTDGGSYSNAKLRVVAR